MSVLLGFLLAAAVLAAWIAAIGLMRMPEPLDCLHAVTFLSVATGTALFAAAAATDGLTDRLLKVAFILVAVLFGGAGMSHALGQAIHRRSTSIVENEDA